MPYIYGMILALTVGKNFEPLAWRAAIGAGLVNGLYASGVFKLGKTTVLGKDVEAKPRAAKKPATPPVVSEKKEG